MSEPLWSVQEFNEILGGELWEGQQDIFDAVAQTQRVAVRSCFGSLVIRH